jgi:FkbH-like protein
MKLLEALEIIRTEDADRVQALRVGLVCGCSPLHLQTFLAAHLRLLSPEKRPEIITGLYGDIWGNFDRIAHANVDVSVALLEWGDLDGRLGLRGLGQWSPDSFVDIVENVRVRAAQLARVLNELGKVVPVVICFPTLPFPPISYAPGWEASELELEIGSCVQMAALSAAQLPNVRVASAERLNRLSPMSHRFDPKSELSSGFPYTLSHSSALAEVVSHIVHRPVAKKGLITDLDDTLWKGILGEDGVDEISWDLEHMSHLHGAYQRFLQALSSSGVLVGVASRNEVANVDEAFKRSDLILSRDLIFPIEANWDAKSESIRKILAAWNVGADSVVFIDDSPIELAEVKAAHPQVECILFPKDNPQALDDLLRRLRDLFGKSSLSEEDAIRRESIRQAHLNLGGTGSRGDQSLEFLKQAEAQLTFHFAKDPLDPRALELVNKTNQFNLNGRRYSEASWSRYIRDADTFLMVAEYQDKYGPLGKIAVLTGRREGATVMLDSWVMSCRAFGRRIEHRCLQEIFHRWDAQEIIFDYEKTLKNGPIATFLVGVLRRELGPNCQLRRGEFTQSQGETIHRVLEACSG